MLSIPTLGVTIVINFLAMGLVWAYVTRCHPKFFLSGHEAAPALVPGAAAGPFDHI